MSRTDETERMRSTQNEGRSDRLFLVRMVALAVVSLLAPSCAEPEPAPVFRIGVLALSQAEFIEPSGRPTLNAARMFADSVNEAGGLMIGGRAHQVELEIGQHSTQVEEVTTLARRLINRNRVHVLIGPQFSGHAIPVAGIAEQSRIPMIAPMSSNPETTAGKSFVFRIAFLDPLQGRVLAQVAWTDLGTRHAGILTDRTSAYSRDIAELFETTFSELGGRTTSRSFPGAETEDFRPWLLELRDAGATEVLLPVGPDLVVPILEQSAELGLTIRYLGSDTWNLHAATLQPAAENAVVSHQWHFDLNTPEALSFRENYEQRFEIDVRATAALTHDALSLIGMAVEAAGSTEGAAISAALRALPPFRGASGTVKFNDSGDPTRSVVISTIRDGENHLLRVVDPEQIR